MKLMHYSQKMMDKEESWFLLFLQGILGMGWDLTPQQLDQINIERATPGKAHYKDKEATTKINGTSANQYLHLHCFPGYSSMVSITWGIGHMI
jgi:hypothetical protein